MYKVICNYLHLHAGDASGSGLPMLLQATLPAQHSAVSSLF